ncbi:Uncharacterized protein conserved in bacteria [Serratia fonticola]|uniref:Uncharacterized protein conserved in bacteria n=1 Tax=Serratia fonticola TaxID=47917 RepID=A0A4U9WQ93_SERFO|nr:Uncharacterized protein conserved in bacteria [Serratia fonticola]
MVYETKRDGKPWYVLVSGNYASSAEAKRAIATLPAEVQAKKTMGPSCTASTARPEKNNH